MAKIQRSDIPRPLLEHLLLRVRERDIDEDVERSHQKSSGA